MQSKDPGNLGLVKDKISGPQWLAASNGFFKSVPYWSFFLSVFMRKWVGLFLAFLQTKLFNHPQEG